MKFILNTFQKTPSINSSYVCTTLSVDYLLGYETDDDDDDDDDVDDWEIDEVAPLTSESSRLVETSEDSGVLDTRSRDRNKYAIHAYTHGPVTGSGSSL